MTTINQIRTALITGLKTVKKVNGYSVDLPDANIYPFYNAQVNTQTDYMFYPKIFLMVDGGDIERLPSKRFSNELSFILAIIFKEDSSGTPAVQGVIEGLIEDIALMLSRNDELGGVVNECYLSSYTTDGGALHPEGAALFRITVTYQTQRV